MPFDVPRNPASWCGRLHLGPVLHTRDNWGKPQVLCRWCQTPVTRAEREQVDKTWNTVEAMLRPFREKSK